MALILAIEPDRRQASHLTAMVRGRLRAEFVVGESAEQALAALGDRVPDLVLTTALLSPKDESALAERLRALDGAAAHVQTLTIPVLATPGINGRRGPKSGGVLSALLGDKSDDDAVTDGCDPAVFAEQCKEYLERAAAERAMTVDPIERFEAQTATDDGGDAPDEALEPVTVAYTSEPAPIARALFANDEEPPQSLMDVVAALTEEEPAPIAVEASSMFAASLEPEHADDPIEEDAQVADVDLSSMLDDSPRNGARQRLAEDEGGAEEVFELDSTLLDPSSVTEVALYTPLARPEVRTWPILEGLTTASPAGDQSAAPAAQVPSKPVSDEPIEWTDIIEALRRDAQPVAIVGNSADWIDKGDTANTAHETESTNTADTAGEEHAAKPIEDEWGFFDPDRAGFAALLAKLEEITEQDDASTPQRT